MDRESPELIKQGMQDTRQSLSEKVAALEHHVFGTIHEATSAVHDTVHSVKNAMSDTISNVKSTFDLNSHIRGNPWAFVVGATVAGIAAGYFIGAGQNAQRGYANNRSWAALGGVSEPAAATGSKVRAGGMFDDLIHMARQELQKITENAFTTLASAVKQTLNSGTHNLVENGLSSTGYQHEGESGGERSQATAHNGHGARF